MNISTSADRIIYTIREKGKKEEKKSKKNLTCVLCHLSHVTFNLSTMQTVTATDFPTMHSRMVCYDRKFCLEVPHPFTRPSKCLSHHNQRLCKFFFDRRKFGALNIRCFVMNFVCPIFIHFLCKKKMKGKIIFEFCQCIYQVFLEYFITILYFSVLFINYDDFLQLKF